MQGVRTRAAVLATAVLAATIAFPATAGADNWYGATGNTICGGNMQDNDDMTYHRHSSLTSALRSAFGYAINNAVADLDNIDLHSEQTSPNYNTDVVMKSGDYVGIWCGRYWHSTPEEDIPVSARDANRLIGVASCVTTSGASGGSCQRFHIYIDESWATGKSTDSLRRLACHETGHTLGLSHPTGDDEDEESSCMGSWTSRYYSDHDESHIDDNY